MGPEPEAIASALCRVRGGARSEAGAVPLLSGRRDGAAEEIVRLAESRRARSGCSYQSKAELIAHPSAHAQSGDRPLHRSQTFLACSTSSVGGRSTKSSPSAAAAAALPPPLPATAASASTRTRQTCASGAVRIASPHAAALSRRRGFTAQRPVARSATTNAPSSTRSASSTALEQPRSGRWAATPSGARGRSRPAGGSTSSRRPDRAARFAAALARRAYARADREADERAST